MALPTIKGQRSGLSWTKQRGSLLPVIQDLHLYTGNVFWVMTGGNDSAGAGLNPDDPFATIDFAIGQCTATQGDVIFVMPGHTETISGAAGIAADVAGISIIGIGDGADTPTITFSATGSTFAISAANVVVKNFRVTCTAATTKMMHVTAAGCLLDGIRYFEGSAIPLQFVLTSNAADQLTVQNCYCHGPTAGASAQLWVRLIGCDNPRILDNVFLMDLEDGATDVMISGDGSVVWCEISRNVIVQTGGTTQVSGILLTDGATGLVEHNSIAAAVTNLAGIVDVGNAAYAAENYAVKAVDKSGIRDPVSDS